MKNRFFILIIGLMFLTPLITSCGGGGGSASGGVGGSGVRAVSVGQIQDFGSIFVNGIEFETDSAEIEIENEASSNESDLRLGMVVRVDGTVNGDGLTGTATKVSFEDNLEGPITSVVTSPSGILKTVVVMGQTVEVVDGVTQFDNNDPTFDTFSDLDAADVGIVVEVSGFTSNGVLQATFIQKKANDLATFLLTNELEVKGTVMNLNAGLSQFTINALTVNYAGVAVIRNLQNAPGGVFDNGLLVEVKGNAFNANTLTATDVEVKVAGLGVDDIAEAEIEGDVTDLGATTFKINGQLVDFSGAVFENGLETELAEGVRVEVEGPIVAGTLIADEVEFEGSVRFEANADTVTATTLTLDGLPGITIFVDDDITEFDGIGGLGDVASGNNLKIRAYRKTPASNDLVALRLERVDVNPDNRVIIQGRVESINPFVSVTILGIVVDTTTINDDDFKNEDTPIGETAFYNSLLVGDLVKARADIDLNTSVLTWDQIEFED